TKPRPIGRGFVRAATTASLVDDGEDVASGEDQVLLTAVLDLGAAVLAVDDDVALLDVGLDAGAVVVDTTPAHRQDGALLGLLLGGRRADRARGRGLLGLEGLHDDTVLERLDGDRHCGPPLRMRWDGQWVHHRRRAAAVAGVGRTVFGEDCRDREGRAASKSRPGVSTRSR